ncbi:urease accessory protein UreD [Microvirga roseola]|uniref:urease accessory protein UreD n=1 Tax=Microvirga roseola TaxID=2883126 RepID=UPI001E4F9C5A|nr:urease accessory protein UreD [Microvirga roseola]
MSVSALPFDAAALRQRAVGRVAFSAMSLDRRTRPVRIEESGSMRIRLPRGEGAGLDAVLVNTAGGIACGDRFSIEIEAQTGASVTVATPAAEKVYRSDGPVAELFVDLRLHAGAQLDWLPQETLLFDRARLARRLDVTMPEDARLTLFEAVVFGRAARAEWVMEGFFEDRWRIRRGGRLIYADTLRLEGPVADLLERPSVGKGARALATLIHVAPDAEARLEQAREQLVPVPGCDAAAGAWNGLLAVRFCAVSIEALRAAACPFLVSFRGEPLPRVWLS